MLEKKPFFTASTCLSQGRPVWLLDTTFVLLRIRKNETENAPFKMNFNLKVWYLLEGYKASILWARVMSVPSRSHVSLDIPVISLSWGDYFVLQIDIVYSESVSKVVPWAKKKKRKVPQKKESKKEPWNITASSVPYSSLFPSFFLFPLQRLCVILIHGMKLDPSVSIRATFYRGSWRVVFTKDNLTENTEGKEYREGLVEKAGHITPRFWPMPSKAASLGSKFFPRMDFVSSFRWIPVTPICEGPPLFTNRIAEFVRFASPDGCT